MREICVIQSCIYTHNTAIATGILPPSGKRNNHLLMIWWNRRAEQTGLR